MTIRFDRPGHTNRWSVSDSEKGLLGEAWEERLPGRTNRLCWRWFAQASDGTELRGPQDRGYQTRRAVAEALSIHWIGRRPTKGESRG